MADIQFSCPHCQQPIAPGEAATGQNQSCPNCAQEVAVPPAPVAQPLAAPGVLCAYCQSPFGPEEAVQSCPACQANYHAGCWEENGGCAIYGCSKVPVIEQRQSLEIPVSYWGREHKPCPRCQKEILAAAVRCRHCGATFASARPEDAEEFRQRALSEQQQPALRQRVIVIFVFCLLPCLAVVGAVYGGLWYRRNRAQVAALPSLYPALCKLGIGVAVLQVIALMVLAAVYSALR